MNECSVETIGAARNTTPKRKRGTSNGYAVKDVKPQTTIATINRLAFETCVTQFSLNLVSPVVGMSKTFIKKVVGHKSDTLSATDVLTLLDQDSFSETFVPRSKILAYLIKSATMQEADPLTLADEMLVEGCASSLLKSLPRESVQCLVTSTPYWAMRLYEDMQHVEWADGEVCPLGMEQTPEGFIRHSIEILVAAFPSIKETGSVWWNLMDTYNTRTQIRGNAVETLQAMQGKDHKSWGDHACRRYSAGHSYLKDGEQCTIPHQIAERASRVGYYVKSVVAWAKTSSLPEPQKSRVSRSMEYVLHLTKHRTPYFDKDAYLYLPTKLGGRNKAIESEKLSDFWNLPTSSGKGGHGAQFPVELAGRCIGLSSKPGDVVLDPFVGSGTSGLAARMLGRNFVGFDISPEYVATARKKLADLKIVSP